MITAQENIGWFYNKLYTPTIFYTPKILLKLESLNPTGSIKDRLIQYIVQKELFSKRKVWNKDLVFVEASSGNSAISLASIGAQLGNKVIIFMPRNMSNERKILIKNFGAEIIETGDNDFAGAIEKRNNFLLENKNSWSPKQFSNPNNVECYIHGGFSKEITKGPLKKLYFKNKSFDKKIPIFFVSGAGTGGTLMGLNKKFGIYNEWFYGYNVNFAQVIPDEDLKLHGIQGIGDGGDFLLDRKVVNEFIRIKTDDAKNKVKDIQKKIGMFLGISTAANILAAEKLSSEHPESLIFTIAPDRGERYMSIL